MDRLQEVVGYLKDRQLMLATAESCTAGLMVSELARIPGSGGCIDCGLAVYSPESKHRYLEVSNDTIERYGLTSEAVALEMAEGALGRNQASVAASNTGLAGPTSGDENPDKIGTVCFAWAVRCKDRVYSYSETRHFDGDRNQVRLAAAHYALERLPACHQRAKAEESGKEGAESAS